MFTGIISEIGIISSIKKENDGMKINVSCEKVIEGKVIGQSIAVDGVCVSITALEKKSFSFFAMPESLQKTIIKNYKIGKTVNLESALKLNDYLDGHMVLGHIDTIGEIEKSSITSNNKRKYLQITYPKSISNFLAYKGSITINGVSLTISDLKQSYFKVDLIPQTISKTNLAHLKKGDLVNIEADLSARYIHRMLSEKENETTFEFLKQRGFI